jgi:hypothetical protein
VGIIVGLLMVLVDSTKSSTCRGRSVDLPYFVVLFLAVTNDVRYSW